MNVKFWDKVAPSFDSGGPVNSLLIKNIQNNLKQADSLLEIGAGTGKIAIHLAKYCGAIEATDFSPEMIRRAQERKPVENVTFSIQDGTKLTYQAEEFDAILTVNTLHIVPDIDKMLMEVNRVLKIEGYFFAVVPMFTQNRLKRFFVAGFMRVMKFHLWSLTDYQTIFARHHLIVQEEIMLTENQDSVLLICKKKTS